MQYSQAAVIKAMKRKEIIAKAMSGEIKWYQAAEILGVSPRHLRRVQKVWQATGDKGLLDERRRVPSPKRADAVEIATVRKLYTTKYFDFNIKHFHEMLVEKHGLRRGYTWTKGVLQEAGLCERAPKKGKHRRRRERRAMVGMLMHLDGSTHRWFGPEGPQMDLLAVLDDANSEVYALLLCEQESTHSCMTILRQVVEKKGVFCELYTDRGSHFCYTPEAGKGPSKTVTTDLGRAMEQLQIRLILANSPQARGRGERLWETIQGRLPQELRLAGIDTMAAAQKYLDEEFLPRLNRLVQVPAAEADSAFVSLVGVDLDRVFCSRDERSVDNDNTIKYERKRFQIPKNRLRATYAGCRVTLEELPNGRMSIWYGQHLLGRYSADGKLVEAPPTAIVERRAEVAA